MEYIVNHSKREIRSMCDITLSNIAEFIENEKWSAEDSYEFITIDDDEDESYSHLIDLINNSGFNIPDHYHPEFIFAQDYTADEYDAASSLLELYNPRTEVMWGENENGYNDY